MKRIAVAVALLIAVGLIWRFPLFHIVRLDEATIVNQRDKLSAAELAESFWNERLLPSLVESADAAVLLAALREDPRRAVGRYGRSVGISRVRLVCVRGAGTVVSIDKQGVGISLENPRGSSEIVLHTGLLFGNTVRDATGLLDASEFSDSRDFNETSTELNRIVERRVIAELKERSKVGNPIKFYACGQLLPDSGSVIPLRLIPLKVAFE